MVAGTEATQKVLLVGKKRICQQVAYVLDFKDYDHVGKLTALDYDHHCDCQIYVCEFKCKSRKLVERAVRTANNIQYLDDILRAVDVACGVNSKPQESKANYSAQCHRQKAIRRKVQHGDWKCLRQVKPSELLLYVLHAPVNQQIQCTRLETHVRINANGEVMPCSGGVAVSFGNLLRDGELKDLYHSIYARIVKLSSLNRSYCLCNLNLWCKSYRCAEQPLPTTVWQTDALPKSLMFGFDRSCNLACKSCRSGACVLDETEQQRNEMIVAKILQSNALSQAQNLVFSVMGEVFYSPYYRRLLETVSPRQNVEIFSNGTLFNETNWRLIDGKYANIDVKISVDAATAETYQNLRGGDFNQLMRNLTMLADLHRQGKIRQFSLNFVVQRDNFREMPAFVELGRTLGVDCVRFKRMNDWHAYAPQEYMARCLIVDDQYLAYELWKILQDPIFKDPIVDLSGLQYYFPASERRYRKRYQREQKSLQ